MKIIKIIGVIGLSIAVMVSVSPATARAEECCYFFNPFFIPFAVAGAVLGTAAAIVTGFAPAPYYGYYGYPGYYRPSYYAPSPSTYGSPAYYGPRGYPGGTVWVPGYQNRYGTWIPGHYRDRVWIPGHYNRYGEWIPGHWG